MTGWSASTAPGRATYASPNALSAYRRIGVAGDLVGAELAELTRGGRGRPGGRARRSPPASPPPSPAGSPTRWTSRAPTATMLRPRAAAAGARRRGRRAGAGPRRHRRPPPRPGAADQGRDDPGDPPPGEEQPADRRRAAAAAGPPDDRAGRPRRAGGVGAPGRLDRGRARDAGRQPGGRRRRRRRAGPGAADARRPDLRRPGRPHPAHRRRSASCRPPRRPRWSWRSPSCCTTPPIHDAAGGPGARGRVGAPVGSGRATAHRVRARRAPRGARRPGGRAAASLRRGRLDHRRPPDHRGAGRRHRRAVGAVPAAAARADPTGGPPHR